MTRFGRSVVSKFFLSWGVLTRFSFADERRAWAVGNSLKPLLRDQEPCLTVSSTFYCASFVFILGSLDTDHSLFPDNLYQSWRGPLEPRNIGETRIVENLKIKKEQYQDVCIYGISNLL